MNSEKEAAFQQAISKQIDKTLVEKSMQPFPEMSLSQLREVLSLTIKHDDLCKSITFLGMLSAYTYDSQLNISFNAPSSSGKTYITSEVAKLFPAEDKIEISGASPTALFYQQGEVDEKLGCRILNLENKILIFYELPDQKVQERLRATASHDSRVQTHFYTNKSKSGANRTDKIAIIGFPAMIFCSASLRINEQEQTREFLLSPEQSQEKIAAAIELQNKRGTDEHSYNEWLSSQTTRTDLVKRIEAIRDEKVQYIKLPDTNVFKERFLGSFQQLKERHTRDFTHVQQLAKAIALLNIWYRKQPNGSYIATTEDVEAALELWEQFSESQVIGVPPTVLRFYKDFIIPYYEELKASAHAKPPIGFSHEKLSNYYLVKTGTLLNDDTLRKQIVPQLNASGMIDYRQPEYGDKRSKWIYPKWNVEN
jgi:hypothetical protein